MSESSPRQIANFVPAGYESEDTDDEFLMVPHDSCVSFDSGSSTSADKCFEDERIKIIPHIGVRAGLGERDFDIELDENIAIWFEGFRESFKTFKKGPLITQRLQMFYLSTQNPFQWALKLFANCSDNNAPKSNSLAYTVMEELATFKKTYGVGTDGLVDDNLRMVAFNFIAKQGHCLLFRMIAETFELLACREMFVPKIREMINRKQYKEAGQIAIDLELFDDFDEHDFVMPLFLQDKISIAEEYLNKAVHLQRPVVKLLDSFFDKKQSVENNCSLYISEHNVTDVYYSKLHQKPLSKLVQRLSKTYNVPKEFAPNVSKMKNFGALQFLLHKRYYEKSLNKDSWDEMVRDTVSMSDKDLQMELVYLCSNFNDQAEAARWAKFYKLKLKDLPLLVQDYLTENAGKNVTPVENATDVELWDSRNSEATHTLNLEDDHVHLVDSREKFYAMISDLRQQSIVAFDSEWKPTFGGSNEVSLIQLATWDDVYLIDVMMSRLDGSDWTALAKHVFNRDDILKLAFAPSTDISMFQKALPAFNVVYSSQNSSGILDLQDLWRYVGTIKNFCFPFEEEVVNLNLANLAKLCVGRKLDKSNQFSNWAQRPLRKEQLQYAALDAYCLLEIFDAIRKQLEKLKLDPSDIINNLFYENKSGEGGAGKKRSTKSKGSRRSRRNGTDEQYNQRITHDAGSSFAHESGTHSHPNRNRDQQQPPGPNARSVFVSEVRFVCDKMLEGLAKMLRRFGIDTVSIKSPENHDRCVFLALQEKRFVLTRGSNYYKFTEYLPSGHCYKIGNDRVEDQLLEVLRYYRIVIRQENIFSRCQLCNCGRFLSARPADIYFLMHGTEMPQSFRIDNRKEPLEKEMQRIKLDRSWILDTLSANGRLSGLTESGARIDTSYVGDIVLANVDVFFICDGCGRCYWDGSHLDNILGGKLVDLLSLRYD
ncbi:exonuclease mut-7 homolog [Malaya genurostris]|uniref:exonuclease mut-7 homolog n=1 Tax=Malaya genurostris TaxID=325434 RepID=UPI0026F3C116|nr:exonuclease mut-7 homolog [Malaya genurostris]